MNPTAPASPSRPALVTRLEELEAEAQMLRAQLAAEESAAGDATLSVLLVRVGEALGSLPLGPLDEVVPMAKLTPLPDSAPWVAGVLDRAGTLIPVLDVQARLERRAHTRNLSDRIVLAHADGRRVGFVVQEVIGLREVAGTCIELLPERVAYGPYVTGVLALDEGRALLFSPTLLLYTSDVPAVPEAR